MNESNWIEMAILCNMMVSGEICEIALSQLQDEYFSDERNRILFRAVRHINTAGSSKRFEALLDYLRRQELMEAAGGKGYITCVYLFVPVGDIDSFIRLLIPKAA